MARIVNITPEGLSAGPIRSPAERARLESLFAFLRECLGQAAAQAREEPA